MKWNTRPGHFSQSSKRKNEIDENNAYRTLVGRFTVHSSIAFAAAKSTLLQLIHRHPAMFFGSSTAATIFSFSLTAAYFFDDRALKIANLSINSRAASLNSRKNFKTFCFFFLLDFYIILRVHSKCSCEGYYHENELNHQESGQI